MPTLVEELRIEVDRLAFIQAAIEKHDAEQRSTITQLREELARRDRLAPNGVVRDLVREYVDDRRRRLDPDSNFSWRTREIEHWLEQVTGPRGV